MNLVSCDGCGVVIDASKVPEPKWEIKDGVINTDEAIWTGREYVPAFACPVCKDLVEHPLFTECK